LVIADPTDADAGDRLVIVGTGFGGGVIVVVEFPPPQPFRPISDEMAKHVMQGQRTVFTFAEKNMNLLPFCNCKWI